MPPCPCFIKRPFTAIASALMGLSLLMLSAPSQAATPKPMNRSAPPWFSFHGGAIDCAGDSTLCAPTSDLALQQITFGAGARDQQHAFGVVLDAPTAGRLFQLGVKYEYHFATTGRLDPYVHLMSGLQVALAQEGSQHARINPDDQALAGLGVEPGIGLDYFLTHETALSFFVGLPTVINTQQTESFWAVRVGLRFYLNGSGGSPRARPKPNKDRPRTPKRPRRPRKKKKKEFH